MADKNEKMTPEKAAAMREELEAFEAEEAAKRNAEQKKAAKPLVDLVANYKLDELVKELGELKSIEGQFTNLDIFIRAATQGATGLINTAKPFQG